MSDRDLEARIAGVLELVEAELRRAVEGFPPLASPHEGIAVIREEYLELEELVFGERGRETAALLEAVQVSAMGARYVLDFFALPVGDETC